MNEHPVAVTPTVIIVNPGGELYRRYCLELAASAYPVAVITPGPLTWEAPYVVDHEVADVNNPAALREAARALAARNQVGGVLTWDEYLLVPAAQIAQDLNLPGNSPAAAAACRDKATSRSLMATHKVPSARFAAVSDIRAAAAAAKDIGYPVVLKPASHAASIGVIRVDSADELADAWKFTTAGASEQGPEGSGVLVEEYLSGPEISVECVTYQGHTQAVALTHKTLAFAPLFEEIGHTVTAQDPLLKTVGPIAADAVRSLGVTDGVQHVEMRLTHTGPAIIEVNGRIGGDHIGKLVLLATGIDLPRAATDVAAGRRPDLTPTRNSAAAITILYPPKTGTLTARHIPPAIEHGAPWLHQTGWFKDAGDPVALPPEGDLDDARVGFAIVTGPTGDDARQRAAEVLAHAHLSVRATGEDTAPENAVAATTRAAEFAA
ncbi:ATP-grasp domain-containing protein [Streptomyces sp. MMBL 11-1]|uniref:ATP-grasp domain-containing protein n=1 Tax=Streptomyces sp. MMBL 11-1 TaxID=3026420 RepID=UPI00235F04E5|nr:ATP-grasp domain-containing protein [Streptomyces sp. MMBL 11-1]